MSGQIVITGFRVGNVAHPSGSSCKGGSPKLHRVLHQHKLHAGISLFARPTDMEQEEYRRFDTIEIHKASSPAIKSWRTVWESVTSRADKTADSLDHSLFFPLAHLSSEIWISCSERSLWEVTRCFFGMVHLNFR